MAATGSAQGRAEKKSAEVPIGVILLAIGHLLVAGLHLVGVTFGFLSLFIVGHRGLQSSGKLLDQLVPFALGIVLFCATGIGLLLQKKWAWALAILLGFYVANYFLPWPWSVVSTWSPRAFAPFLLVLAAVYGPVIWYLFRPRVRQIFGLEPLSNLWSN